MSATQTKILTFKAALDGKRYRILEIEDDKMLAELAQAVVEAFDFDLDHAFGFYDNPRNIDRSDSFYELFTDIPDCDSTPGAKGVEHVPITEAFQLKTKMALLFDYGDEWIFQVTCQKIDGTPQPHTPYPRVIKEVGGAPLQYLLCEEEEDAVEAM